MLKGFVSNHSIFALGSGVTLVLSKASVSTVFSASSAVTKISIGSTVSSSFLPLISAIFAFVLYKRAKGRSKGDFVGEFREEDFYASLPEDGKEDS